MRKKLKEKDNPAEMIYKLIMNSSYGKTILKPINKTTKLINDKDTLDNYINNNFEFIDKIIKINDKDKYIVSTHKHINDHFNAPHVGTMILSNSKRIMNKVFDIAENNDINIFYQDTDSLHIYEDDLEKLIKIYEKNGDKLVGVDMLNFHSDFKLKGAKYDIKSEKSIFLGKKCYINYLSGYNEKREKIYGYHMRMKGVSTMSIYDLCNKMNNKKPIADPGDLARVKIMIDTLSGSDIKVRPRSLMIDGPDKPIISLSDLVLPPVGFGGQGVPIKNVIVQIWTSVSDHIQKGAQDAGYLQGSHISSSYDPGTKKEVDAEHEAGRETYRDKYIAPE
jgi:hypothetical protein